LVCHLYAIFKFTLLSRISSLQLYFLYF
jgi:hypothetical protein